MSSSPPNPSGAAPAAWAVRLQAWARRHRKKLIALCVAVAIPLGFHWFAVLRSRMSPPSVELAPLTLSESTGIRFANRTEVAVLGPRSDYARGMGRLLEVRLVGTPTEIGQAHARLLKAEMDRTEEVVWGLFRQHVTSRLARALLLDLARLRYADLDSELAEDRRTEIAAQALSYQPDPFDSELPTYQRFVFLNALYDISLSFEQSPLIGCTTFVGKTARGGGMLGRAFDFEVHPIFDREKIVFLVREDGKLPFASVAWAGLVGVVSGMNSEGLSVVVHGARAGEPGVVGEPVVHALRRVLSEAKSTAHAVELLATRPPLVSHLVILNDAKGDARVVERVPGEPNVVRALDGAACVTNHLEGPSSKDAKNRRVRELTSTLPRRKRGDELIERQGSAPLTPELAAEWLRDRNLAGGKALELGDRRAIDAGIATHAIIADSTARTLWVSEGPNLDGDFVAFELSRLLAADYTPRRDEAPRQRIAGRNRPADDGSR